MSSNELNVQRALGRIEGKLDSIEASLKQQHNDLVEHKAETGVWRKNVDGRLRGHDQFRWRVTGMATIAALIASYVARYLPWGNT